MGKSYDVVIVGAGLTGLTAGISLQLKGLNTHIIEKGGRPGGLCGNCIIDGYEFTVACNDFGLGLWKSLSSLGVDVSFQKKKTLIFSEGKKYALPPNIATLWLALSTPFLAYKYYKRVFADESGVHAGDNLQHFVDDIFKNSTTRSLLKIPSYLMGVSPDNFYVSALSDEVKFGFGYHQPLTPEGGPDALIQSMVQRYEYLGGEISLNCEYLSSSVYEHSLGVETSLCELTAKDILSTVDWSSHERNALKRGLPLSVLHVAVSDSFLYPEGIHTMVHYPSGVHSWFTMLDSGVQPDQFGFHLFKCGTRQQHDYTSINIYFYQPRNDAGVGYKLNTAVENYILGNIEEMLPGFNNSIIYKHYTSPESFTQMHGHSSRVMPYVMPPGFVKSQSFSESTSIFNAGNACHPPGDHAGAAIQSALIAAEEISQSRAD